MLSSSDATPGAQLPVRVRTYIEALVQTCAQDRAPLVFQFRVVDSQPLTVHSGVSDLATVNCATPKRMASEHARTPASHVK